MNILYLHCLGPQASQRLAVTEFEYMVENCVPDAHVFMFDGLASPDASLGEWQWDVIVLGATFLSQRNDDLTFEVLLERFEWIASHSAIKIARPQDEYNQSARLDCWLRDWRVDVTYTVCPTHWEILFPTYRLFGTLKLGFTSYLTPDQIAIAEQPVPFSDRSVDILYRASRLPAHFGEIGRQKWEVVERFLENLGEERKKYRLDLSNQNSEIIQGTEWRSRLSHSKSTFVTPSGSDLIDTCGLYASRSSRLRRELGSDDYGPESQQRFDRGAGWTGLTVIAPRNIEAAVLHTVQIAYPSSPIEFLQPGKDYLLLNKDFSNAREVMTMILDRDLASEIATSCAHKVLAQMNLRSASWAQDLLGELESRKWEPRTSNLTRSELAGKIGHWNSTQAFHPTASIFHRSRRKLLEALYVRTRAALTK